MTITSLSEQQAPERRSIDRSGEALGYEDVFTKLEHAIRHYEAVGLGKDHVRRIVR